jgi:hypothetical protein
MSACSGGRASCLPPWKLENDMTAAIAKAFPPRLSLNLSPISRRSSRSPSSAVSGCCCLFRPSSSTNTRQASGSEHKGLLAAPAARNRRRASPGGLLANSPPYHRCRLCEDLLKQVTAYTGSWGQSNGLAAMKMARPKSKFSKLSNFDQVPGQALSNAYASPPRPFGIHR